MLLTLPLFALLIVFSAFCLYQLGMAVVYFAIPPRAVVISKNPRRRFAVIVPAYNEEAGIGRTVQSLRNVAYPEGLREIVVVADNCADDTANKARDAGARVLERCEPARRGKGFALAYALEVLLKEEFDAFVVIDADSTVSGDLLSVFDAHLATGREVVQAFDGIANPDATFITYVFAVGNGMENRLFYEAKGRLGLSALLRGNGMCFSADLLRRVPWRAYSIAEDTEYSIALVRAGVPVAFAPEARVLATQPETLAQARMQRVRWASGNLKLSRTFAIRLVAEGVRKRSMPLCDAGLTLVAVGKPLTLLGSILLFAAGWTLYRHSWGAFVLPLWGGTLLAGQVAYLVAGVCMEGFRGKRLRHLLLSPFMVAWLFVVTVLGIFGYRGDAWVRTQRPS